jgi:protein TonB
MLALLAASYWLLYERPSRLGHEVPDRPTWSGGKADVEVPSIDTSSSGPNELPEQEGRAPNTRETSSQGAQRSTSAPKVVAERAASEPARPTVKKISEEPSRPGIENRPIQVQTAAPANQSPPDGSTKAGSEAEIVQRAVREKPSVQPPQPKQAAETERPPSTAVGKDVSDSESTTAGKAKEEQKETSEFQPSPVEQNPKTVTVEKPSEPEVQVGDLVEPGPDTIHPVLLEHPKLRYPKEAKKQKIEGVVRVRVLVDENGKVVDAELEERVGYGLDNAALGVAARAKYIPATKGTVFVKMWTVLPLVYQLEK